MRALTWHGKHDVRVDTVPDPEIINPRDAIIKITSTAICGSDLHLYDGYIPTMKAGDILGHEIDRQVEIAERRRPSADDPQSLALGKQRQPLGKPAARRAPEQRCGRTLSLPAGQRFDRDDAPAGRLDLRLEMDGNPIFGDRVFQRPVAAPRQCCDPAVGFAFVSQGCTLTHRQIASRGSCAAPAGSWTSPTTGQWRWAPKCLCSQP